MQELMGNLNNLGLMMPFTLAFRFNLNKCLGDALSNDKSEVLVSDNAKKDLLIWAGITNKKIENMPIPVRPSAPPLFHKVFVSDAAGFGTDKSDSGVACVGFNEEESVFMSSRIYWNETMISQGKDPNDKLWGNKSAFLESIGLLLPFITVPENLKNQHVVLKVDNMGCVFGWENRQLKGDAFASIILRSIHLISAFLGTTVHVVHLPRVSNWEADLVDRLSRKSSTTEWDEAFFRKHEKGPIPSLLVEWLQNPSENWSFCTDLLNFVKQKINC